ncbi:SDR family NAD(P)-dependent oxidoreductase [Agromyces intestinalis]|uniref:SDR family NAD(P)-dependent oxidoreductase n=1 Tax=Agromyces intestinalis TaxID=2592652 RepID=A0A5C1YAR3_9MICO|nr:SDR family NAD(P)-dependent oxidoreductase [Agromyces intestinalis]QEO13071.1 SDR family NAD(P)-dependent oxidoreductase [Agromyces intestinalis]
MTQERIALVTGANKGLGFATARLLAQRGLTVLLGSRDAAKGEQAVLALQREGLQAQLAVIDVTDDASVTSAVSRIDIEYGHLDVLVNNAGVLIRRPALLVTADEMRIEFETNVFGMVRVVHGMLPLLRRAPDPRIVNVSSDSASFANTADPDSMFGASHESFVYSATKAAVNMLTLKYAHAFLADPTLRHVKINAVTPGYTATDLNGFRGSKSPEEGATAAVRWATVGADGTTGGFFDDSGRVPW